MGNPSRTMAEFACRWRAGWLPGILVAVATAGGLGWALDQAATAPPGSALSNPWAASVSDATRREAVQAIPLDRDSCRTTRTKVQSVLSNVSIFRRLPTTVMKNCNPDLYLFLVRHPDIVINIWEIHEGQPTATAADRRRTSFEAPRARRHVARFAFVYRNHDTHVLYGEGRMRDR